MKKIIFALLLALTLAISAALCASAIDINEAFTKESFEYEGTILPYRLYLPENLDQTKSYPVVLFLHGAGERGDDNEAQLKNMIQVLFDREDKLIHEAIVVVPQCPTDNQWVDTPWADGNYSVAEIPESNELAAAVQLVLSLADKYSCDKSRLYVMGISMGGFGTWDALMRHSDVFAAGIPVCGGADPDMAEIFMELPVFTFHGTADASVPYEGTAEMVEVIEDLGSRVVNFITYTGEGHGIWNRAAAEEGLMEWLFAQKKVIEAAPQDTEEIIETEPALDTEAPDESSAEVGNETKAPETQDVVAEPDNEKGSGGLPIGAVVAIVSAILVVVVITIVVKTKEKK